MEIAMDVNEQWEGNPDAIDGTYTEFQLMAGGVRVRLLSVEEADASILEILMLMKT
jgi:hypothetical protein